MSDLTVLYYSSNREKPEFEAKTIAVWLAHAKALGLPVISVTQQPMPELGVNLVVGDVGASGFNMFRQVRIGLEHVQTPFVISAEADCLYPRDYFQFVPPRLDRAYRNRNLYVMPQHRAFFWNKPEGATHAQVVGTQFYRDTLDRLFEGAPMWSVTERNFPKERTKQEDVFTADEIEFYDSESPVVQFKTSDSMRHYTHSDRVDRLTLPYWGDGRSLRRVFL